MRVMPPPPPPSPHSSRIDLAELKSQITKRIGMERSRTYFSHLNRFLLRKLPKQDFDRLCLATLGRRNVPLHNRLVAAVLRNAHLATTPPPPPPSKRPLLPNGDALPHSPRRVRSNIPNRRTIPRDRPSPLGPNAHPRENGESPFCDLRTPTTAPNSQQQRPDEVPNEAKVKGLKAKVNDSLVELVEDPHSVRAPVEAPLGIPFCPPSVGGARRPQSLSFASEDNIVGVSSSCSYSGQLHHNHALKERMERIAESQGLTSVMPDCAKILNAGLDSYLKRLIRSSVELVGARSSNVAKRRHVCQQPLPQPQGKVINGIWSGSHVNVQHRQGVGEEGHRYISKLDFRVAMELNARQLGEDWPLQLEKICLLSYQD